MEPGPAVLVLACAGLFGVTLVAQDPGARGRVEQVRVEVRVTDSRQNPVMDLQASDFEITDDNQRQAIVTFIPPGRVRATTAAAPNTLKVTDAVRRFIETVLSPADSVAVAITSGAGGGQDFTADRRLVLKAIDRFRGQKLRSAIVERMNDPQLNFGGVIQPNADGNKPERANRARVALETLQKIGEALAPFEDRRPMVLWVSEGPEYEVTDRPEANESNQWSISRSLHAAIERLNRVNAVMYAIDPRGVSAGNADQIQTSTIFEMYRSIGSSALRNEEVRAFGVVQTVATNTGGFAMLWRPNMSADFRRVTAANESYYLIGYEAPSTNRGQYHAIAVRVRRQGVQVRARTGYFLPAG